MAKKTSKAAKSVKKPAASKEKKSKAKTSHSKPAKAKHAPAKKAAKAVKAKPVKKKEAAKKSTSKPAPVPGKQTVEQTKTKQTTVGLSKLGKATIKPKAREFTPRKIEKLIDISKLETKLQEIMKLDHTE